MRQPNRFIVRTQVEDGEPPLYWTGPGGSHFDNDKARAYRFDSGKDARKAALAAGIREDTFLVEMYRMPDDVAERERVAETLAATVEELPIPADEVPFTYAPLSGAAVPVDREGAITLIKHARQNCRPALTIVINDPADWIQVRSSDDRITVQVGEEAYVGGTMRGYDQEPEDALELGEACARAVRSGEIVPVVKVAPPSA